MTAQSGLDVVGPECPDAGDGFRVPRHMSSGPQLVQLGADRRGGQLVYGGAAVRRSATPLTMNASPASMALRARAVPRAGDGVLLLQPMQQRQPKWRRGAAVVAGGKGKIVGLGAARGLHGL
ncbi:hypothetical protein ACH4D3_13210 [Streptomyces sp. NPDC018026]|uniref:hypothetical protein n=1 Tax=Streptomyces sp. NPDC018026 TaxID=3365031 RepID=UPI0037984672